MQQALTEIQRREMVRWAYRLFLDREPESDVVLERRFSHPGQLRQEFLSSNEFRRNNPDFVFDVDSWVIKETCHGFRMWVSLGELGVSRPILRDHYDGAESAVLKRILQPGNRVLDIGANIGFYSLLCAHIVGSTGRVIGFEPLADLHHAATKSVAENGFQSFVEIKNRALADIPGVVRVRHAPGTLNFGGGHIATDMLSVPNHIDVGIPADILDGYVAELPWNFIKLDVEGAEPRVIRGGEVLIARDRPVILSEINNVQLEKVSACSGDDFIKLMRGLGYRCTVIAGTSFEEIASYTAENPINVFFWPVP